MKGLAAWIVRQRLFVLIAIGMITAVFGIASVRIEMYTSFADLLPTDHPFIRVHNEFSKIFGGANLVLLSVEVKEGDIFNPPTLEKVKKLTELLELTHGVNNYQIFSIARQKVKDVRATSWGIEVQPIMWPEVPRTDDALEQLRDAVYANPTIAGRLVSMDGKAALITAAFHEERLDYAELFRRIRAGTREVEDANTMVYAAGEPILYGWIYHHLREILLLMGLTCVTLLGFLILYYRNLNGVLIPILSALTTFIWGTGFTALMGYNFDPLILVVPFLIAARTISHSIQFRERFFEELERCGEKEKAAIESTAGLMMPGGVSILTDAIGLTVLLAAPMPILTKLAIAGSFWVLSNIFSVLILDPILCCYFPTPRRRPSGGEGHWLSAPLRNMARLCTAPAGRWLVVASVGALIAWSLYWNQFITVGDSRPGSPLLWPESAYNVSVRHINEKFQGTDYLYVIMEGKTERAAKSPAVLRTMEALQRHLEQSPNVGGTDSIAALTRQINTVLHHNDPRWGLLPKSEVEVGGILMVAEHGSEPGDFDRWVNYNFQHANLTVFLYDHRGDTIRDIIQRTKGFIASHPIEEGQFRLAGGIVGVLAAANEVINESHQVILGLILLAQWIICTLGFRSMLAGLLFVGVVFISNTFGMALMAFYNIGLNVNTIPVMSLGVGFGVDYGIYIVSRAMEEHRRQHADDVRAALIEGVATAGKAVLYTAFLISAGIIFWVFSPLRFQAEMGYGLLIILTMNMLGGLIVLPAFISLARPRFFMAARRLRRGSTLQVQRSTTPPHLEHPE